MSKKIPVSVSKKILADVSSGIYRTPANALKELVSNAFDASAKNVFISTNIPYFNVFTCEDDGEGISTDEFKKILKRIGSSQKRADGQEYKKDRPLIGKIGIGLLAIAQISNRFTVISKKKNSKYYFQATLDLRQFNEIEKESANIGENGEVSLGECELEESLIDEIGPERHYTKIIMEEIKEGFKEKLLEEESKIKFGIKEKAIKSDAIINFIESVKNKRFTDLSQYDQLIWELCSICPIEYLDKGPLPDNKILFGEIKRLKKYNFKVFVDGFEIRKPILFPTDDKLDRKDVDHKIYPKILFNEIIKKSKLSFSGYVFHQRTRILPAELRGILIRIRGVAIGNYDRTFLHYPKAEGPMVNQLSGEIFVEDGLEEALNIDRNSFNETHPHFLAIQKYLWEYLGGGDGVFKDIRRRSKKRQDLFHEQESEKEFSTLLKSIKEIFKKEIKIDRSGKKNGNPYTYDPSQNKVVFHLNPFWSKNKKQRIIQEKIVLRIVAAKDSSDSIESFEKNLLRLLSNVKWKR